jgi:hypothetical protein
MRNNMLMPRSASDNYRIQSPSFPEIQRAFERAAIDLVQPTEDIGRKLKTGPLLQSVVLWFLVRCSDQERIDIARDGKEMLEAIKAADDEVDLSTFGIGDAEPIKKQGSPPSGKGVPDTQTPRRSQAPNPNSD